MPGIAYQSELGDLGGDGKVEGRGVHCRYGDVQSGRGCIGSKFRGHSIDEKKRYDSNEVRMKNKIIWIYVYDLVHMYVGGWYQCTHMHVGLPNRFVSK